MVLVKLSADRTNQPFAPLTLSNNAKIAAELVKAVYCFSHVLQSDFLACFATYLLEPFQTFGFLEVPTILGPKSDANVYNLDSEFVVKVAHAKHIDPESFV